MHFLLIFLVKLSRWGSLNIFNNVTGRNGIKKALKIVAHLWTVPLKNKLSEFYVLFENKTYEINNTKEGDLIDIDFCEYDIVDAINKLNKNSAVGPDG